MRVKRLKTYEDEILTVLEQFSNGVGIEKKQKNLN